MPWFSRIHFAGNVSSLSGIVAQRHGADGFAQWKMLLAHVGLPDEDEDA